MRPSRTFRAFFIIATLAMFIKETEQSQLKEIITKNNVRLVTSKDKDDIGGGIVQVYHNGQWGTICDTNWALQAAKVVCNELGYRTAIVANKKSFFATATGPIHLSNVTCTGIEDSILKCASNGWGNSGSCSHKDDAGVRCFKKDTPVLKYQGCWIDNPHNRILKDLYSNYRGGGIYWNNILETVLNCATDADKNSKDYNTFAIQYYGECWSEEGNPDYRQMRAAPHACTDGVGDKSHNAVYSLGAYYDLGCWQDRGGSARTMTLLSLRPKRIDWVNLINNMENTIMQCYNLAKANGYKYFGLQFYGECWASNDGARFRRYGQVTSCYHGLGGKWTNYVYMIR